METDQTSHSVASDLGLHCLPVPHLGIFNGLKRLDILGRSSAISVKEDSFCDFLFSFLHASPFYDGSYSIRKAFAPCGSKCFPYRLDLFFRWGQNNSDSYLP